MEYAKYNPPGAQISDDALAQKYLLYTPSSRQKRKIWVRKAGIHGRIFSELLDEEEVIYELIVDRVNKDEYRFCTRDLPHSSFYSITCERDDISEVGRPSTPNS